MEKRKRILYYLKDSIEEFIYLLIAALLVFFSAIYFLVEDIANGISIGYSYIKKRLKKIANKFGYFK